MKRIKRGPAVWMLTLLLLSSLSPPARAETRIQDLYAELQRRLAPLRADPFDPQALPRQQQALFAEYAGRELRIPGPPAGIERSGTAQGLWPLEYRDGRLQLRFAFDDRPGQLAGDRPWDYWTVDRSGPAQGQTAEDGRPCRLYSERSGYGIAAPAPASARFYVDDAVRVRGQELQQHFALGQVALSFATELAQARELSGRLATYVRLARIEGLEVLDRRELGSRVSQSRHCYAGQQHWLIARIERLRIHDQRRGEDLLQIRFGD